jgi:hypothetical protein
MILLMTHDFINGVFMLFVYVFSPQRLLPKNRGQFIGKCFSVVEKLGNENEGQGF